MNIEDRMLATIEKNKEAHRMAPRRPLRISMSQINNEPEQQEEASSSLTTSQHVPTSIAEYSSRSQIARAYHAGVMPFVHSQLFQAIKKELGGAREGEIILQNALNASGIPRRSALNILKHMSNFGVLITETRYRRTWVKISPEWFSRE